MAAAPIAVAATGLLIQMVATRRDPLDGNSIRCAEQVSERQWTFQMGLATDENEMFVSWDHGTWKRGKIWVAAAKKIA
ncbi:MAG: hypothetical protein KBC95_02575 [Candidatus Peribacteraceae bacterium]|nr:hypothetical protein [Candidatus Peribacteraceae bacterium]